MIRFTILLSRLDVCRMSSILIVNITVAPEQKEGFQYVLIIAAVRLSQSEYYPAWVPCVDTRAIA